MCAALLPVGFLQAGTQQIEAVSYTHLDVYKRQTESGVHLHSSGWWLGLPQKVLGYGKFKICVKSKDDIILLSSEGVSLAW